MTTKRTTASATDGGTMDTHANASSAGAARAQAELIDLLARLVLASVEHSATAKEQEPFHQGCQAVETMLERTCRSDQGYQIDVT